MSGIKKIQQRVSSNDQPTSRGDRKEIWINDKDYIIGLCPYPNKHMKLEIKND